ncbi:DNA replication protein DnaC [Caloramator mitchellensis]|uniref:DNA replication protein DnaC n=1 Tax=Caloramator mitchellensis TaxID=908809 RepID=A0A0R3JS27_CALMK|nr:ATP-binding protein [Caloramator mitchellensis]KRQ86311.1 DNA replication protein DnaC [Caloramator mitchellensis]
MLRSKIVLEILEEYEKLQNQAKEMQKERQREVYNKIPRLREIDEKIKKLGVEMAMAVVNGSNYQEVINQTREKITSLRIEKGELLSLHKVPLDFLEIKYICSKCNDTGFIGNQKCSCFKQKLIDKLYQQSNLKEIIKRENFDTFNISYYSSEIYPDEKISPRKNMERIFTSCLNFVNNFDLTEDNLFFYGSSGLGKTFLSHCIAKDLLDRGKVVIYQTAPNLMDIIKSAKYDENSNKEVLDDILDCDLLIIDDLGTEPNHTGYSQLELFNIINTRLLKNKKMVISTNLPLEDFDSIYAERIKSRILGSFILHKFIGEDIRLIKRRAGDK